MIKITLFGPTGLIGNEILKLLENDSDFEKINVVSRRPVELKSKKSNLNIINFKDFNSYLNVIDGSDVVLAAIGTTQSKVSFNKKNIVKLILILFQILLKLVKKKTLNTSHLYHLLVLI